MATSPEVRIKHPENKLKLVDYLRLADWMRDSLTYLTEHGNTTQEAADKATADLNVRITKANIARIRKDASINWQPRRNSSGNRKKPSPRLGQLARFVAQLAEKLGEVVPDEIKYMISRN